MDYADIRLLHGDQGQGKSCTSVALPTDEYYSRLTGVIAPNGQRFRARPLNPYEINAFEDRGLVYNLLKHVCIYRGTSGDESKIISLPNDWIVVSPLKIFANFHFYGIRYAPITGNKIIEYINTDTFNEAWIILDESVEVDKQDTMTREGKMTQKFGAQVAKRDAHLIINSQYLNMIQGRFAMFATTRVQCSYDRDTKIITLDVNEKSPTMQSTSYYAPPYWKFYKRGEIVKVSQDKIDKILSKREGN